MKKYQKEIRINGVWYQHTIDAESVQDACKRIFAGKRLSYGIIEAVRGRWQKVN